MSPVVMNTNEVITAVNNIKRRSLTPTTCASIVTVFAWQAIRNFVWKCETCNWSLEQMIRLKCGDTPLPRHNGPPGAEACSMNNWATPSQVGQHCCLPVDGVVHLKSLCCRSPFREPLNSPQVPVVRYRTGLVHIPVKLPWIFPGEISGTPGNNQGNLTVMSTAYHKDKTSYRKISWSLEAARLGDTMVVSVWNLTGISAALLPRSLSNYRAVRTV